MTGVQRPLEGRVGVVTGVSRRAGIGFAVARRLAAMGARLWVHSLSAYDQAMGYADPHGIEAVLTALREDGAEVHHSAYDLADPSAPEGLMRSARQELGSVDILVANHAYSTRQPLLELSAAEIDRHLQVNTRASLLLLRELAEHRAAVPGGRVILLSSGQHRYPMPAEIAYAASKAALAQVTPSLAAAVADLGITVNCVDPGPTDTGWAPAEEDARIRRGFPAGRWGAPEDAARLIAWLCTDDAAWITGQLISSDGGWRPV